MDQTGGYAEFEYVSEFYDWVPQHQARNDIDFYLDAARKYGQPILELGCGTGRVLIPLAREGSQITGMDLSEPMLARCREKLAAETPETRNRAELKKGDIRNFNLGKEFELITAPFRVFQHQISVNDQISALSCIHRHLRPEGHLILDFFNPSLPLLSDPKSLEEFGDEPEFKLPDGRRIHRRMQFIDRNYFDQIIQCMQIYYVSHPDGRRERLTHGFPLRYSFRYEIEHLLIRLGFRVEEVFGDYNKNHFGNSYPGEMIFVAQKSEKSS